MKKVIKYLFIVFAVIIGLAILIVVINPAGSDKKEVTQVQQSPQPQEQAIAVTAAKLLQDYEANEVSADAQYKGKIVEVSGAINTIGKDILDTPYVSLSTGGGSFFSIQCMFEKSDQAQLATLSKDTRITLRGRVSGKLGNIIVRECSVVR